MVDASSGQHQSQSRPFMTSFKSNKPPDPYGRNSMLVIESIPGAGPRIMDLHKQLCKLAENMDKKVHNMLHEHEQDFFLAYKTHMYGLQKEFKALKTKADEEDTKTHRDSKIQSLERKLDWFMAEALRLDEVCKGHKKEVDKWKAKAEAIEEDRRYLEDQIKGSTRQNKVLRAAVERVQYAAAAPHALSPKSMIEGGNNYLSLPPLRQSSSEDRLYGDHEDKNGRKSGSPGDNRKQLQQRPQDITAVVLSIEEQKYIEAIKNIKTDLAREQAAIRSLRAERADTYSQKSALEEFFLECIDESRKELSRKSRPGVEKTKDPQGKIKELLLSSEDALVYLYEKLFPHRSGVIAKLGQNSEVLCP